ncbi:MAG: RDD family protein [Chitinophagales bacterium]
MLIVKLDTGFNIEVDFPISPFHRRLFAWIIDLLVMIAYTWTTNKLLDFFFKLKVSQWLPIFIGLPLLFYHLTFEVLNNGQSIGKMAMSIKVISAEGGQPSLSQFLIRWVFRLADLPVWILIAIVADELPWWCSILVFSGLATVIFSKKSQRIGDLVAGTIIIDTKTQTSWQDTVFTELESDYHPSFPEVMRLSDKDINTLKSIIDTVRKKSDHELGFRIAERIKTKFQIRTDKPSLEFLETLLKDYNYYSTK